MAASGFPLLLVVVAAALASPVPQARRVRKATLVSAAKSVLPVPKAPRVKTALV
jgi:hypothetical protein